MSEILLGVAQLAIAVAGFSGLLYYFGNTEEFSSVVQLRLDGLISYTAAAAVFSLIGLLLHINVDEVLAAVISSGFWFAWTAYYWIRKWSLTIEATRAAGTSKALSALLFVSAIIGTLQLMNIFHFQTMEIFVVAPVFSLGVAITLFLRNLGDLRRDS